MTGPASARVHPAPSGNEPARLASRRFNNYARDPEPTHEPGSLFLTQQSEGPEPAYASLRLSSLRTSLAAASTVLESESRVLPILSLCVSLPSSSKSFALKFATSRPNACQPSSFFSLMSLIRLNPPPTLLYYHTHTPLKK